MSQRSPVSDPNIIRQLKRYTGRPNKRLLVQAIIQRCFHVCGRPDAMPRATVVPHRGTEWT
jgi:hypothetical protein